MNREPLRLKLLKLFLFDEIKASGFFLAELPKMYKTNFFALFLCKYLKLSCANFSLP